MSISFNKIRCPSSSFHLKDLNEWVLSKNAVCIIQTQRVTKSHLNFKTHNLIHHNYHYNLLNFTYNGRNKVHGTPDAQSFPVEQGEPAEVADTPRERSWSTTKVLEQLKRYGVSGVLSYGLLNTAYYLTTFLTVWFYLAPAPGKMGYLAAASRFLKVMAMVWAGSQVTKLLRAAGALALAPVVDRGLSWFTAKFRFESRGKAFFAIVSHHPVSGCDSSLGLKHIQALFYDDFWALGFKISYTSWSHGIPGQGYESLAPW